MEVDEGVQSTNDDASECKRCAVHLGYWDDKYIYMFVRSGDRKAPEINRGYFARTRGIRILVDKFLKKTGAACQIVNFGAGFDTLYWQLKDQRISVANYIELDFPAVTSRKCYYIKRNKTLLNEIHNEDGEVRLSATDMHAGNYHLVGVDLRNLSEVEQKLMQSEINTELPTLFISECVLVYIESTFTMRLLSWISSKFPRALYINYEQVSEYVFAMSGGTVSDKGTYFCKKPRNHTLLSVTGSTPADESIDEIHSPVGYNVFISCYVRVVQSLMPITVSWFKFGEQVHPGDRMIIDSDLKCEKKTDCGDGVSCMEIAECSLRKNSLIIENAKLSDGGDYRCVAVSSKGYAEEYCVRFVPYVRRHASARILLIQTSFTKGEQIRIPCEVDGVPKPRIMWYLDNKMIPVAGDNKFTLEDHGRLLIIKNAKNSDSGYYKCKANNLDGSSENEILITIV